MPGLSIIVPAGDDVPRFEDTLAAVLRNRPRACEVIVPHAGHYADPYELASEVWFIELAAEASREECLAHAIDKAAGDVVHVLSPGCEFDEGWYQPAVEQFTDASIGCVSPLMLPDREDARKGISGVHYGLGGRREVAASKKAKVLGPTYRAGFYRRAALKQIGGWPTTLSHHLGDVDVALSLKQIGYRAVVEPESAHHAARSNARSTSAYTAARQHEHLFWRHNGGVLAMLARPLFAARDCVTIGGPASMLAAMAGKFASLSDIGPCRARRAFARAEAAHGYRHAAEIEPSAIRRRRPPTPRCLV